LLGISRRNWLFWTLLHHLVFKRCRHV